MKAKNGSSPIHAVRPPTLPRRLGRPTGGRSGGEGVGGDGRRRASSRARPQASATIGPQLVGQRLLGGGDLVERRELDLLDQLGRRQVGEHVVGDHAGLDHRRVARRDGPTLEVPERTFVGQDVLDPELGRVGVRRRPPRRPGSSTSRRPRRTGRRRRPRSRPLRSGSAVPGSCTSSRGRSASRRRGSRPRSPARRTGCRSTSGRRRTGCPA